MKMKNDLIKNFRAGVKKVKVGDVYLVKPMTGVHIQLFMADLVHVVGVKDKEAFLVPYFFATEEVYLPPEQIIENIVMNPTYKKGGFHFSNLM